MSNTKILSDRRQALEDRFFQDQEAKNIALLREKLSSQKNREDLRLSSGIESNDLLDELVKLGVAAGDLSAVALIPLVQVAWADGSIRDSEREAVLKAALQHGLKSDSHSQQLLEAWLATSPPAALYEAWSSYVGALVVELGTVQASALKESIVGLAHDVADAAGGILGMGSVSKSEQQALSVIAAAFDS